MAGHRCMLLLAVATRRLSRCFWMQAQMLYCLMTLESCSFQVRTRCLWEVRWGICELRGLWVVASACSLIVGLPIPPLRVLILRLLMLGLWGYPGLSVLGRARVPKKGSCKSPSSSRR